MTKKEFITQISHHVYGKRADGVHALFFDWKQDADFRGFKFCAYARQSVAKKQELINVLYDIVHNNIEDSPYYIQLVIAFKDSQRFKVPIVASGLNKLINYNS